MLITKATSAAIIGAATVLLTAVAVAQDGGEREAGVVAPEPDPITAVIGALTGPRAAEDRLPADAAREVAELGPEGARPELSVRAAQRGEWTAYLVPAHESVCLSLVDSSGGSSASCRDVLSLRSGSGGPAAALTGCEAPAPTVAPTCETALVYGVVPDGVEKVTVVADAGLAGTAAIENNVYLVEVPMAAGPAAVAYTARDRTVQQRVPFGPELAP